MVTRYPGIVEKSATAYAEHLATAAGLSIGGRCAAQALVETLNAALSARERLTPEQVVATWRQLAAAETRDADGLMNQWQLGYGSDAAAVISIGIEHAYELMPRLRNQTPADVGLAEIAMEC